MVDLQVVQGGGGGDRPPVPLAAPTQEPCPDCGAFLWASLTGPSLVCPSCGHTVRMETTCFCGAAVPSTYQEWEKAGWVWLFAPARLRPLCSAACLMIVLGDLVDAGVVSAVPGEDR